jgi:hypothetical protein
MDYNTNGIELVTQSLNAFQSKQVQHKTNRRVFFILLLVHENVDNPALNTRPTIFNPFFVHFYHFRDGSVKSLISNMYNQNIRS